MIFYYENTQFWVVNPTDINNEIGDIDLFLLDLILKGKVPKGMKILDAGCGSGRNLFYFLKQGYEVSGIDSNGSEVKATNFLSRNLGRNEVCSRGLLTNLPFEDEEFDFIICSRVLHFAKSQDEYNRMFTELSRVLSSTGLLYLSMDSMIGLESKVREVDQHRHQFPDGSMRFLLSEEKLSYIKNDWLHLIDPRTVNFNGQHAETTLVLFKD